MSAAMNTLDQIRELLALNVDSYPESQPVPKVLTDAARMLAAVDAVTALADKWQSDFPYKATELRTALTTALGGGA